MVLCDNKRLRHHKPSCASLNCGNEAYFGTSFKELYKKKFECEAGLAVHISIVVVDFFIGNGFSLTRTIML